MFLKFFKSYMNEFVDFINDESNKFGITATICRIYKVNCHKNLLCLISLSKKLAISDTESMFIEFLKSKRNINASNRFYIWAYEGLLDGPRKAFYVEVENNDWEALNMSEDAAMISQITDIM